MSVFRPNLFQNSVAIVTGGATGIGRAISYELLHLGAKVVIASRNMGNLQQTAKELSKLKPGFDVTPIACNIRKEDDVRSLITKTLQKHGKIDMLVNNGGGQFISPAAEISLKGWNAVLDTNLTGAFLASREVYTQWFRGNGGGNIVNMSAEIWSGWPQMCHSAAARAAVNNLTKTLSIEWASSGVRINNVAPGLIVSPTAAANYKTNFFEKGIAAMPCHRTGLPDEVAGAVCFLLSPAASFITGACINIDCGSSNYRKQFYEIEKHNKLPPYKWIPEPIAEK